MKYFGNDPLPAACAPYLDMAAEASAALRGAENREIPGVSEELLQEDRVPVHVIRILDEEGERLMGRRSGSYITIDLPPLHQRAGDVKRLSGVVARHLQPLLPDGPLLLVGLGNSQATPDALGPQVAALTCATRHLMPQFAADGITALRSLAVLTPGVMGNTGISTPELVAAAVRELQPAGVIVVDALAAGALERVGSSIQLADTGLRPGAGVGSRLPELSHETLGIPVIAIGVPTVIDTLAILRETLSAYHELQQAGPPVVDEPTLRGLSERLLGEAAGRLLMTPKDVDKLIADCAHIVAAGIARAVHPGVNKRNFYAYLQ
ncbi:MAG: GPR endopeptidase [Firmicutes bacterium]|nr:GPR endopeptidase [Bacillota bacterium]